MSAEWMVDVPADLAQCWYVMPRPAGWRCLVSTAAGTTRVQGRSGAKPRTCSSSLPNGSRHTRGRGGACELDCIWSEAEQVYYVLDVVQWNGQRLVDCPAEFRRFWLHSKLAEVEAEAASASAGAVAGAEACRFVPLLSLECTPSHLHSAYAGAAPFGAPKDGLLFLHREALYEAGASPLLLSWSDATCSARFFDYGTPQMAAQLTHSPEKADRWRTAELAAAVTFAELLQVAEQPPMVAEAAAAEPLAAGQGEGGMEED